MMPEILTESFCERCGTRYTFESAAPRKARRLGQIKTLSKGMKNWVMSDDTSLDEAMAAARNDDDRELTSQQLDAFHATFNFCMTCRQYTCGNCWNAAEGRCLTCAPHLGHEILPAPFPDQVAFEPVRIEAEAWPEVDLTAPGVAAGANGHGNGFHPDELDAWASTGATDVENVPDFDPAARLAFLSGETPLPVVEPEEAPATEATTAEWPASWLAAPEAATSKPLSIAAEPVAADSVVGEPDAVQPDTDAATGVTETAGEASRVEIADVVPPTVEVDAAAVVEPPATPDGWAGVGAMRTTDLLRRFRPGQNIDAELAAYEAELAAEPEPAVESASQTDEPVAEMPLIAEPVAEPVAMAEPLAPEPEPVAAAPEPESVAAEVAPVDVPDAAPVIEPTPIWPIPAPEPMAAEPPREDRIEQPTWQIFAPEATPPVGRPLEGAVPPVAPVQPPFAAAADPQWPVQPDLAESPAMVLLANRARGSQSDGLWAASAREVLAPASVPAVGVTAGVQPCSSCGLSLSATARFCRRCGTRQG
jgi:hypothetical protein